MNNKGNIKEEKLKMKVKKTKQEQGITLLVLVITIVVLIILSTVTISAVLGDGGLIEQARRTKEDATNMIIGSNGDMNELLQEYVNVMSEDGGIENPNENDIENPDQNEIEDPGTDEPTIPEGWDGDKVEAVESEDGKTVPVPKGYVESKATGENTVIGGFVIYEGNEEVNDTNITTSKTSRNQFVWVPVEDINDIAKLTSGYDTNGRLNYQSKLYNFSNSGVTEMGGYGQGTSSYREPAIVTDYDNSAMYVNSILGLSSGNMLEQQLQQEFNEIIESVDIYGGFYIGRYETGNLSSNIGIEPVVVKGNSNISNVNWFYMYRNSKLIGANENVKSTMIWGGLWDRTLIWLAETNIESSGVNGKSYAEIVNSTGWGNYSTFSGGTGNKQATGNSEAWKSNNVYDLAGNVYDWTLEAYRTGYRVIRGGAYNGSGTSNPVYLRDTNNNPATTNIVFGSRSALYITV